MICPHPRFRVRRGPIGQTALVVGLAGGHRRRTRSKVVFHVPEKKPNESSL
jgi:hypothetical protein